LALVCFTTPTLVRKPPNCVFALAIEVHVQDVDGVVCHRLVGGNMDVDVGGLPGVDVQLVAIGEGAAAVGGHAGVEGDIQAGDMAAGGLGVFDEQNQSVVQRLGDAVPLRADLQLEG